MILGIGIDTVSIKRFKKFQSYSTRQLLRIYSLDEIAYCLAVPRKSAERFAGRFAAKEALYKAISQATGKPLSFLLLCKKSTLTLCPSPTFTIDWPALKLPPLTILTTITHNTTDAQAVVLIQN